MRSFKGLRPEHGKPRFSHPLAMPSASTALPDQVNVVFVYGAGNDERYGEAMRDLRDACIKHFGNKIYSPRIIDHRELDTLVEALLAWSDPTVLVGHSCAGETVTQAANRASSEAIPYIMVIAPSVYCDPDPVGANVLRITQASSDNNDPFNPREKTLIAVNTGNDVTVLDVLETGMSHLEAPASELVIERLILEIDYILTGDGETEPEPGPQPEPDGHAMVTVTIAYPAAEVELVIEEKPSLG